MSYQRKTWTEKLYSNTNMPKFLEFDPSFPFRDDRSQCGGGDGAEGQEERKSLLAHPLNNLLKIRILQR